MRYIKVRRPYLTIGEVAARWGMADTDLRRVVMDETLRVAIMRNETLAEVEIREGNQVFPVEGEPSHFCGWLFPVIPAQVGAFECAYAVALDPRDGKCYALNGSVLLTTLMQEGVAFMVDVEAAEAASGDVLSRPLSAKAETSRDKFIVACAIEVGGYMPWEPRSRKGLKRLLDALEVVGMPMSPNTVKAIVRAAYERARSKKLGSPPLQEWPESDAEDWDSDAAFAGVVSSGSSVEALTT